MSNKKIPVILITGYLGSGKTTLMQNLLKQEQRKIALIVNDMGSVNIDAALLNKNRDRIASVEMVEAVSAVRSVMSSSLKLSVSPSSPTSKQYLLKHRE